MTILPRTARSRTTVIATAIVGAVAVTLAVILLSAHGGTRSNVLTGRTASYRVTVSVDNPRVGTTSLTVTATDSQDAPARLSAVTIVPIMPSMGHATGVITANATGPGRYQATGVALSMAGQWELKSDCKVRAERSRSCWRCRSPADSRRTMFCRYHVIIAKQTERSTQWTSPWPTSRPWHWPPKAGPSNRE